MFRSWDRSCLQKVSCWVKCGCCNFGWSSKVSRFWVLQLMFILPCQAVFALIIPLSLTKYSIIWNISNVVLTSQALGHAFVRCKLQSVLFGIGSNIHLQGEILHRGRFFPVGPNGPVILWSYGPLLSVRRDCSDAYGPSLYIVQTLSRVTEGSSHEMLLKNEYD